MAKYFNNTNALYPTEKISYRKGTVTGADYAAGTVDVLTDSGELKGITSSYQCSAAGAENSLAFCVGDDVVIRYFDGSPQFAVGFADELWPCIPMPAAVLISGDRVFSRSVFQDTGYTEADRTLFLQRYETITQKSCSTSFTTYINQTAPDMTDKFIILETDTYSPPTRDVNMYYDGEFMYHTSNSDPSGVFNGTRSNVIAAFINPMNMTGVMVYQINTFTNWVPQTSGHVDFNFYLYSSCGISEKLCSASCDVTGASSAVTGEVVTGASGFYCDDTTLGGLFVIEVNISQGSVFSATGSTNAVQGSDRTRDVTLSYYLSNGEYRSFMNGYSTDSSGLVTYPDGSLGVPAPSYYKKKR